MNFSLFVSCPQGLEYLLEDEVRALGLKVTRVSPQGVYGKADLETSYNLCIWSRLANRVQLILFADSVYDNKSLYQLCYAFAWKKVFSPNKTIAIEFHGLSNHIRNSMFGAQLVKDAIVDHFQKSVGMRPSIDRENPDIRLHARLKDDFFTLSLDLTGYSLHQRGYRVQAGAAPIKENIAAAMLIRAQWPKLAAEGFALEDAFCGSGTVVIEAALMAAHIAPGLIRKDQAVHHWVKHDPALWEKCLEQAREKSQNINLQISGSDIDEKQVEAARANAERAGVHKLVEFKVKPMQQCRALSKKGLFICNPPYGERLEDFKSLVPLYQDLGKVMHDHYQGWQAAILTSDFMLAKATGLRSAKQYTLFNGALKCKLYCMSLNPDNQLRKSH